MPTISLDIGDLSQLVGKSLSEQELDGLLDWCKAELKGADTSAGSLAGDLRVELNDTNRPDLWCAEGIARQLRGLVTGSARCPVAPQPPQHELLVDWIPYRPFAACILARGYRVTPQGLRQIIQTQEKLTDNFGHHRKTVSVGVYNAAAITFPVSYRAVAPRDRSFVPLGCEAPMDLARILAEHPKGREYAHILAGRDLVPILEDASGKILSFPPIINSRELGEVQPGDDFLMIEVTGTDLTSCLLVLNIFAANLADRGAVIEAVTAVLPPQAHAERRVIAPCQLSESQRVPLSEFRRLLGEPELTVADVARTLSSYGVRVTNDGEMLVASIPPHRNDYLHPVDVIEDFAIAHGYNSFEPVMPRDFTVGKLAPLTVLTDQTRDILLSFGFEELISNALTSAEEMRSKMGLTDEPLVAIANPMSESYSVVRDSLLPLLLRAESKSGMALYPHRIFEAGDVVVRDATDSFGSRTLQHVAAAVAHGEANFSEAHGYLDRLAYELGVSYRLEPEDHPSFIPGRSGRVILTGGATEVRVGWIGEFHPRVLDGWGVGVPVAGFELTLDELLDFSRNSA